MAFTCTRSSTRTLYLKIVNLCIMMLRLLPKGITVQCRGLVTLATNISLTIFASHMRVLYQDVISLTCRLMQLSRERWQNIRVQPYASRVTKRSYNVKRTDALLFHSTQSSCIQARIRKGKVVQVLWQTVNV